MTSPAQRRPYEPLTMVLPLGPSVRHLVRVGKAFNGRCTAYTPHEVEAYKQEVRILLHQAGVQPIPKAHRLAVVAHIYRARKVGDLDNFLKVLLDALNGVAFEDDSQVVEIHAYRHDDKAQPRVEVDIHRLEQEDAAWLAEV